MADDCPGCQALAAQMRAVADSLAAGAGSVVGGRLFGPRGATIGSAVAPSIVEKTALAVGSAVKKKRRQSKTQKARSRKMSKAMKTINKKARLKNGSYRKGWDAKRVMRAANRMCK